MGWCRLRITGSCALIRYVHTYILETAWYTAQLLPTPEIFVRQVNSAIAWYLWYWDIFRSAVHITTIETGRWMGPYEHRSKKPSFVYPPAPDPQPKWELSHIRMAPEMGPGESGDKHPYIPDTSTVGIFTHICTGLGVSHSRNKRNPI